MRTLADRPRHVVSSAAARPAGTPAVAASRRAATPAMPSGVRGLMPANLPVSQPEDSGEREAELVADQILRVSVPCPTRRGRAESGPSTPGSIGAAGAGLLPPHGRPLDAATRAFMEPRFGCDFSRVRIHAGADAESSAAALSARAYTVGHHIVFGADQFSPGSRRGQRLLAHELAHVVQQTGSLVRPAGVTGNDWQVSSLNVAGGLQRQAVSVQRDVDTETQANWARLGPSIREQVQDLDRECDRWIQIITAAQIARASATRSEWLAQLRIMSRNIQDVDSDSKWGAVEKAFQVLTQRIGDLALKYGGEWYSLEKLYKDLDRWLRSNAVKSIDSNEAAKYLADVYRQSVPKHPSYITQEDYAPLKDALEKHEYIRIGALRGTRIRAAQLMRMMRTVWDLLRQGEDANKFIPGWSERVSDEAAYLDSFALLAKQAGRDYAAELVDLRKQLLKTQDETSKVKPADGSVLEKGVDLVTGAVEAVTGIFVEAAKEAVDLAQIQLHFVSFGQYEPRFISDMAEAAKNGASTTDLLKGMVTGVLETPSRFLKACRDGDWKAIGREAVNLYALAEMVRGVPEVARKLPGWADKVSQLKGKLPELIANTRACLIILRERAVSLGLKNEGRLMPEPAGRPAPAPAAASTGDHGPIRGTVQGGGQGTGEPIGKLRDSDKKFDPPRTGPPSRSSGGPANDNGPHTGQDKAAKAPLARTGTDNLPMARQTRLDGGQAQGGNSTRMGPDASGPPAGQAPRQHTSAPDSGGAQGTSVPAAKDRPRTVPKLRGGGVTWANMDQIPGMKAVLNQFQKLGRPWNEYGFKSQAELVEFVNKDPAAAVKELQRRLDSKIQHAQEVRSAEKVGSAKQVGTTEGAVDAPHQLTAAERKFYREEVLGKTPSKTSTVGLEVRRRMRAGDLIRDVDGKEVFFDARTKKWYPVDSPQTHMGHTTDAVTWWNEKGRLYAPKSAEVRAWMKNPDIYMLEYGPANSAAGASLGAEYGAPHPNPIDTSGWPKRPAAND
jgi:Domain of unknown function (DUF4157)/HNH/ENDO VII superfamily nuclease with conserved GHE residues